MVCLTLHSIDTLFDASTTYSFWKHCGKRRNCSWRAISSFPTFSTQSDNCLPFVYIFSIVFLFAVELEEPKIGMGGKGLTLSQITNFRLLHIDRVGSQQFWIWWKYQKVLQEDRKCCGKRRNCSLRAIFFSFPIVFSEDLYCRHVKTRACLGKACFYWYTLFQHDPQF